MACSQGKVGQYRACRGNRCRLDMPSIGEGRNAIERAYADELA